MHLILFEFFYYFSQMISKCNFLFKYPFKVFAMLLEDSSLVKKIASNTKRFRSQMTAAGFTILGEDHPISPVMLGDAKLAADFADDMLGKSLFQLHIQ